MVAIANGSPGCGSLCLCRHLSGHRVLVNVFYKQGVAVVIYNPDDITTIELGRAIEQLGADSARFHGAEIIGQGSAQNVLRL